jgi:hypothetical protein
VLDRIRDGSVTLAFRRWRRPTVRSGGTLLTAIGQLRIASVSAIADAAITEAEAGQAGYSSRQQLLQELNQRSEGEIYRIEFGAIAPDPRVELRASVPDAADVVTIRRRLEQIDSRSTIGPWTERVLALVAEEAGVRAEILASRIGMEKLAFKSNVRKLKALGLTISLGTGYQLSPRGESVLASYRPGADGRLGM